MEPNHHYSLLLTFPVERWNWQLELLWERSAGAGTWWYATLLTQPILLTEWTSNKSNSAHVIRWIPQWKTVQVSMSLKPLEGRDVHQHFALPFLHQTWHGNLLQCHIRSPFVVPRLVRTYYFGSNGRGRIRPGQDPGDLHVWDKCSGLRAILRVFRVLFSVLCSLTSPLLRPPKYKWMSLDCHTVTLRLKDARSPRNTVCNRPLCSNGPRSLEKPHGEKYNQYQSITPSSMYVFVRGDIVRV